MHKLSSVIAIAIVTLAGAAWGQSADKKAEAKPAPEGADMMKPPAELQEYKTMLGNWKCQGQGTMMGKQLKMTGTYRSSWELDNHWVVAHFEGKAAGMPGTQKGVDFYGYDPASKMFTVSSFDNFGMTSSAKSKGWEGDKQEWAGKGTAMGKEVDIKWTVTKKSDKEVTIAGGMGTDSYEMTCKK